MGGSCPARSIRRKTRRASCLLRGMSQVAVWGHASHSCSNSCDTAGRCSTRGACGVAFVRNKEEKSPLLDTRWGKGADPGCPVRLRQEGDEETSRTGRGERGVISCFLFTLISCENFSCGSSAVMRGSCVGMPSFLSRAIRRSESSRV